MRQETSQRAIDQRFEEDPATVIACSRFRENRVFQLQASSLNRREEAKEHPAKLETTFLLDLPPASRDRKGIRRAGHHEEAEASWQIRFPFPGGPQADQTAS